MYSPTLSLADPPADSPIADGVGWVQSVAFGSIATTIAVIAVGAIGLLMLSGRLELRRGITAVIGCFALFGAASIAFALTGFSGSKETGHPVAAADIGLPPQAFKPPVSAYDPYAGASVPDAR